MQAGAALDPAALRRIARKLHADHAKETADVVSRWTDLADEERKLWVRLAARAANETILELTATDVDPLLGDDTP